MKCPQCGAVLYYQPSMMELCQDCAYPGIVWEETKLANGFKLEVDGGRIVIPEEVRRHIGLDTGECLQVYVEDGEIILRKEK